MGACPMKMAVLDIESYFDKDYTFSKMSTEEYTRDSRFEAHGAAIKWSRDTAARWYPERQLRQILKDEDWSDIFLVSHHAQWDHLALAHWYGVKPAMSGCTLSMARLILGNHLGVSLDSVRKHFGLAPKITPYSQFIGLHWHEMSPQVQQAVADGACDECESIWRIFELLMREFPIEELETVHHTIRMFSDPVLHADVEMLAKVWEREDANKRERMAALDVSAGDLQSDDRFADLLRAAGVEPEKKPGKPNADGSEKLIYAFAKNDDFMRDLLEDEDEYVKSLVEARLSVKSTALQTRAETLGYMAGKISNASIRKTGYQTSATRSCHRMAITSSIPTSAKWKLAYSPILQARRIHSKSFVAGKIPTSSSQARLMASK